MGSRKTGDGVENVYKAAQKWVDSALRTDDSLFKLDRPIWTRELLGELRERFSDKPDVGQGDFYDRLRQLLKGSPPEVYQLMGEVLYAQFLIIWQGGMGPETKKSQIEQVLGWGAPVSAISKDLVNGLAPGIAQSQALTQQRQYQVTFIIELVEHWKEQTSNERENGLRDPWTFKDFVTRVNFRSRLLRDHPNAPSAQREAVLHLVHPDTFEGTVSVKQKEKIAGAKAFTHFVTEETPDVDRKLIQIRRGLEAGLGRDFDFYDQDLRSRWDPSPSGPWDSYLRHASEYLDTGQLKSQELSYKFEIGRKLAAAREAVLSESHDLAILDKSGLAGNLIDYRAWGKFRKWINTSPDDALKALQSIWTRNDSSISERIRAFSDLLSYSGIGRPGTCTSVAAVLLMGIDVEQYPPFRVGVFKDAYERTGYDPQPPEADEAASYEHALEFLDRFIREARTRGLPVRHRLDAQSLVWAIRETGRKDVTLPEDLQELAEELLLTEPGNFLREIDMLLADKKQVVFQGPPGTGKTYVARALANHLAGSEARVTLVQFHPSYAYEDFVQGFRPTPVNGQTGFKLEDGPLLQAAKRAREEPDEKHFLVIDEINRGNLAKVFGELYFLLEYRDEKIRLQYQREGFSLPHNLHIIGTMNTADRSIALVDLALRRRFYFVEFHPDSEPIKGVLRRWLKANANDMEWVADVVERANERLSDDRHAAIGPSYFMKDSLDEVAVERIWKHSVLPYIEERLFGESDRLGEFALDKLRGGTREGGDLAEGEDGAAN